jgi:hypothetical protein
MSPVINPLSASRPTLLALIASFPLSLASLDEVLRIVRTVGSQRRQLLQIRTRLKSPALGDYLLQLPREHTKGYAHRTGALAGAAVRAASRHVEGAKEVKSEYIVEIQRLAYPLGTGAVHKAFGTVTVWADISTCITPDTRAEHILKIGPAFLRRLGVDLLYVLISLHLVFFHLRREEPVVEDRVAMPTDAAAVLKDLLAWERAFQSPPSDLDPAVGLHHLQDLRPLGPLLKGPSIQHPLTRDSQNQDLLSLDLVLLDMAHQGSSIASFGHYCHLLLPLCQVVAEVEAAEAVPVKELGILHRADEPRTADHGDAPLPEPDDKIHLTALQKPLRL